MMVFVASFVPQIFGAGWNDYSITSLISPADTFLIGTTYGNKRVLSSTILDWTKNNALLGVNTNYVYTLNSSNGYFVYSTNSNGIIASFVVTNVMALYSAGVSDGTRQMGIFYGGYGYYFGGSGVHFNGGDVYGAVDLATTANNLSNPGLTLSLDGLTGSGSQNSSGAISLSLTSSPPTSVSQPVIDSWRADIASVITNQLPYIDTNSIVVYGAVGNTALNGVYSYSAGRYSKNGSSQFIDYYGGNYYLFSAFPGAGWWYESTNGILGPYFSLSPIAGTPSAYASYKIYSINTNYVYKLGSTNGYFTYTTNIYGISANFVLTNIAGLYTMYIPATTNFVQTLNSTNGYFLYSTNANGSIIATYIATNTPTSTLSGIVPFALLSASPTAASPSDNELVTASYAQSLASVGVIYYNTTNIDGTNTYGTNSMYLTTLPAQQFSITNIPVVGQYMDLTAITNISAFAGPLVMSDYIKVNGSGGIPSRTLTLHYEVYYSTNNGVTISGDWSSPSFNVIVSGTTNVYVSFVPVPFMTLPVVGKLYTAVKVDAVANINSVQFFGGTGTPASVQVNTAYGQLSTLYQPLSSTLTSIANGVPASAYVTNNDTRVLTFNNLANQFSGSLIGSAGTAFNGVDTFTGVFNGKSTLSILSFNAPILSTNYINFGSTNSEIYITNSTTFLYATNIPNSGVKSIMANVIGTNITVGWPASWTPSNTNSYIFTNAYVAFRVVAVPNIGTNITAIPYQP